MKFLLPDGSFKGQGIIGLENETGQPEFLSGYKEPSPLLTHTGHIALVSLPSGLFVI